MPDMRRIDHVQPPAPLAIMRSASLSTPLFPAMEEDNLDLGNAPLVPESWTTPSDAHSEIRMPDCADGDRVGPIPPCHTRYTRSCPCPHGGRPPSTPVLQRGPCHTTGISGPRSTDTDPHIAPSGLFAATYCCRGEGIASTSSSHLGPESHTRHGFAGGARPRSTDTDPHIAPSGLFAATYCCRGEGIASTSSSHLGPESHTRHGFAGGARASYHPIPIS
jgi:hypothetical protein